MPIQLDAPLARTFGAARIEAFTVEGVNAPIGPTVYVTYTVGDVVEGSYVAVESRAESFAGMSVVAKMLAPQAAGTTIYSTLKAALYALLQEGGFIGTGAIT